MITSNKAPSPPTSSTNGTPSPLTASLTAQDQVAAARAEAGDLLGAVDETALPGSELDREAKRVVLAAQTPSDLAREQAGISPPNFRLGPDGMVYPKGRDGTLQGGGFFTPSSLERKFGGG